MSTVNNPSAFVASEAHSSTYVYEAKSLLSQSSAGGSISIGLELEIFLRDKNEKLANLQQSQEFLKVLAQFKSWKTFSKNIESDFITRVSFELPNNRYHSVKYEHPPHMVELALGYYDNLIDLKNNLELTLKDLQNAASKAGLHLDISSSSEIPELDWNEINKIESRFEKLSKSRSKIFSYYNGSEGDFNRINFPSFTAATQYHIGGVRWWEQHALFMNKLYLNEFLISANPYKSDEEFLMRWDSYRYVFSNMKLLGFPKINEWSFESWIENLIKDNPFEKDLIKMRDLQIIKPKWIGTLEFRSDPATDNLELIISQAALRLASYLNAMKPEYKPPLMGVSLEALSDTWSNGGHVSREYKAELENLNEHAWDVLRARNKGEEGLL